MENLLGKLTGIDIGVYDLETNAVARMVGDTEKLQALAKQNADEIKNVIGEIKDLNDEFSRVRHANVLGILGYPQDTQLTAFTEASDKMGNNRTLGTDKDNVNFYHNVTKAQ